MRARQRHLNLRHTGASLVLDSRYINQSDNTAISQWDDRSGNANNASQATAANRPTFQTAECGGNGIVSWDGTNDYLSLASSVSNVETAVFAGKERQAAPNDATHFQIQYVAGSNVSAGFFSSFTTESGSVGMFDGTSTREANFSSANLRSVYGIAVANRSSIHINGVEPTYALSSTPNAISIALIGARTTAFGYCYVDMCSMCLYTSTLAAALRRRVQNSLAYSFKIACS